jgi:hypothetical protein
MPTVHILACHNQERQVAEGIDDDKERHKGHDEVV